MKRAFIVSVGTSVVSNYKRENPYRATMVEDEVVLHLKNSMEKGLLDKTSAEIKTLSKAGLSSNDLLYLLSTDTEDGEISGKILERFFKEYFELKEIETHKISALQVSNPEKFKNEGIINLFTLLSRIELKTRGLERYLVASGGFKAVVPYLTIAGILYRIPVLYIFEKTDSLIELPPFPIRYDYKVFRENEDVFERLEKEGKIDSEIFKRRLSSYSGVNFILKKEDSYYILTDEGKILWITYMAEKEIR